MVDATTAVNTDTFMTQLVLSVVFSYLLEKAKNSKLIPFINCDSSTLNRVLAIVVSGAAAVGVHLSTVHVGDGTWVLTVSGLQLSTITASGFAWLKSFVVQEVMYQKVIKDKTAITPV